jgi:hypothetical protein
MIETWEGSHAHHSDAPVFTAFPKTDPASTTVGSEAKAGSLEITGKALTSAHKDELPNPSSSYSLFRQYSWQPSSKFHKLLRELWKYIQSIEDEHYHMYYKGSVNEETLRDYSSAIQEIIPRLAKVQSVLNHNARGFPDMMRWKAPTAEPLHTKAVVRHGAQDCQEFAVLARNIANKKTPISSVAAGAIIQGALACQAAASKAAIALQRAKFGDPVCDPATVIAGFSNSLNTVAVIIECDKQGKFARYNRFL